MAGAALEPSAPPPPIVALLERAVRRRRGRTLLEAGALGIAGAAAGVAAAQWSIEPGASAVALAAFAAAGAVCGLFAAGTWWTERAKTGAAELARRLDARLAKGGALSTAFEARRRGEDSPVALALEERALAGIDGAALARALPGPGWIWLAPPALACALAALAFEAPRGARGNEATSAALAGTPGPAHAAARRVLEEAQRTPAGAAGASALRAELAAASATLERAETGGPGPETRALLAELALEERRLAAAGAGAAGAAERPPERAGAAAATGGGGEPAGSLLTAEGPDRRMVGSNRPAAASDGPPPAPAAPALGAPAEAGTTAGRWWPERYDAVLQSWRRALDARAGSR